jgi:putative transposase
VLERVGDFAGFLAESFDETASYAGLRQSETTGRPLGAKEWIAALESGAGRALAPRKRGPRPR